MKSRKEALLEIFNSHPKNTLFVVSTGFLCRSVCNLFPDKKNVFYMQGSMGLAPCIALGVAFNTSKDVVAISGDGAHLMHLGITHTIRDENLKNFYHYVLDNGSHESVGGYKCAPLEESYCGVNKIFKISKDGKSPRVGFDFEDNKNNFIQSI